MAEKEAVHPISKEDLEQHLEKVNMHMESINLGGSDRPNLFPLLSDIGGDKHVMSKEVQDTIYCLRQGFGLYYEMYALIEDHLKSRCIDGDIDGREKIEFLASYSMFAASSFIENKLNLMTEEEPFPTEREKGFFKFNFTKDDVLNSVLSAYYGSVNLGKRNKKIKTGSDLLRTNLGFFRFLRDEALAKKDAFTPKLLDLVKGMEFRIADEFDLFGYTASQLEEKVKTTEFTKVYPNEVVGNLQAKRKVIRYMDRLALYDPKAKMNPFVILGGLSWTNLWDGLPGTGKTTMIRMAMTRLAELCDVIGIKYKIHSIDQAVKSEFYGKTGQNALQEFNSTKDPKFLHLTIMDDLDLLTAGSRYESGGADNDLRNVCMQFLDGAFTLKTGSNQVYAASNDPKGLDPAMGNRFNDRILVEGPKTVEDFADMAYLLTRGLREMGKLNIELGYKPLETQDNYVNGKWTKPDEVVFAVDPEFAKRFKKATLRDFGQYIYELKQKNQRITARSVKAIYEAVKERSANFDIPAEFFEKPTVYRDQPFNKKLEIIRALFKEIPEEVLFEETKRYFESEERYSRGEEEREVERGYNSRVWNVQAEIKAMENHPELYSRVLMLRRKLEEMREIREGIAERVRAGGK